MRRLLIASTALILMLTPAVAHAGTGDTYTYTVKSNVRGFAYLSMENGDGGRYTVTNRAFVKETPDYYWWQSKQTAYADDFYAQISVQTSSGDNRALIQCELRVNGKLIDYETARGPYAMAICSE